jgi:iron complex outermembrane receptor protein
MTRSKRWLATGAALLLSGMAFADNDAARVAFNIEPQPIRAALEKFADQTGLQVVLRDEDLPAGAVMTPRVVGDLSAQQALQQLLMGTELRYEFVNARTIRISTPRDGALEKGAYTRPSEGFLRVAQTESQAHLPSGAASAAGKEETSSPRLEEVTVVGVRELGYNSRTQSSALFGEQSILDTPFQVTAFPIELLQDQQVRTLFHVAKNDASTGTGNNSGGVGFYDSVSIRGFTLANESGYYREGSLFPNNAQMPFENKAAVEIVKGLTALRYGFTAPGGIVNYVLKRPTETPYRFMDVFGDSNGGYGVHLDLGGKISDDIGVRFNAVRAHEEQFIRGVDGKREMVSMFLTWTPTDQLLVEADAEYQYRDTELGQNIDFDAFDPNQFSHDEIRAFLKRIDRRVYVGEEYTRYPTRTFMGSVRMTYELSPDWKLRLAAQKAQVWRNHSQFYWVGGSMQTNGDYDVYLWRAPDQEFSPLTLEASLNGTFMTGSVKHELVVGAMQMEHPNYFPAAGGFVLAGTKNIFDPSVHIDNPNPAVGDSMLMERLNQFAVFATDYMHLTDSLNLFAGVRYSKPKFETFYGPDHTRDWLYDESAVTPSGGIIFKPRSNVSIYASYAEGLEVGGQAPVGTENVGQVMSPLKSKQYELGVKADLVDGATFSAAVFEIDKGLELVDNNNYYVQDGRQVHRGVEAMLAGQLTPDLRLVSSALYLDAELKKTAGGALDGKQPFNVPKFKASLYANWRLPIPAELSVNAGAFYSGKRFVDTANTFAIDGYVRFDAGLIYGFPLGQTQAKLRLIVENLTDKNYFSGTQQGFLMYGEPRTFRMSLSASY